MGVSIARGRRHRGKPPRALGRVIAKIVRKSLRFRGMASFYAICGAAAALPLSQSASSASLSPHQQPVAPIVQCKGCPAMVRISVKGNPLVVGLLVARTELTWRDYLVSVDEAGCAAPRNRSSRPIDIRSAALRDNYPMTSITPDEIACYIDWVRAKSGKPYRLPTEAEWKAIASIGLRREVTLGELPSDSGYLLNRTRSDTVDQDSRDIVRWRGIVPVGLYAPSAVGIYDLFGNASEATSDRDILPRKGGGAPFSTVIVMGGRVTSGADFRPLRDSSRVAASVLSDTVGFRLICKDC